METAAPLAPTDWNSVKDAVMEIDQRYAMDSKLYVQFYLRPVLQTTVSDQENRPIYQDVEHVRIMVPGDKLSIIDRIASIDDKQRFPDHYAKFKSGHGEEVIGTRLEVVPWMTRSKVEEYKFFHIVTVEQLADANDQVGQKFPGFNKDREHARKFLEAATGTSARVGELERQIAELKALVSAGNPPDANPAQKSETPGPKIAVKK